MTSIIINHQQQQQQQQQQMAIFKRPQHNVKLATILNNMLQCGSLVDVTIYCDDGQVNAHKLVLAASSAYFRNLFSRMTNAFHYPIIVLREMQIIDLKTIIQFIYNGEVNVPQNRVDSLMRCANYLEIDGMSSSANSLNAILASSSAMSLHSSQGSAGILTSTSNLHSTTASALGIGIGSSMNSNNIKLQSTTTQYPPTTTSYTKQKGHGSRSSAAAAAAAAAAATNNNHGSSTSDNSTTNAKPKHTCLVCQKTFTHGFTLKRHMKLHSQSRPPIFCDVCSKSYSCKDSYLRHKKSSGHINHAYHMNLGPDR